MSLEKPRDAAGKRDTLDRLSGLVSTSRSRDRRTAARDAAELIRGAGGYRWVGVYDVTESEIAAIAWTGDVAPAYLRFPRSQGLNGVAVATRDVVISQDVSQDPRYLTAFATTGSEAIVPISSDGGQVVGTIDVESDRRNAFSAEDEVFLRRCAVAISPLWRV
jgi:putative methionine-R-sulfoxide reductase with GAF domain